jgi:2,4-dienoyl-CoA reductase-like NADH-dependent reductase (Old Yellow Enzyme family)
MRLTSTISLPCGLVLPNRLAKAAMTEGLATDMRPNAGHIRLYERWAQTGAGLHITGNVVVDRRHQERPGNVVLDGTPGRETRATFAAWAQAAKSRGAAVIMQLSHAGRQTPARINARPMAPSAVPLGLPGKQFAPPQAMPPEAIEAVIDGFTGAARFACESGFDGVQIHAAHGYLISQFLSPLANRRDDTWGGSLENRARLLTKTVTAVRAAIGPKAALSVKLNSADFQKGGFDFDDSLIVAGWLKDLGVDLLEVSGGSYEQPKMMDMDGLTPADQPKAASTRSREAYFLEFARAMLAASTPPLMVTGGFRSAAVMEEALTLGVAVVGVGRPLCATPDAISDLLAGRIATLPRIMEDLRVGPGPFGPASGVPLLRALNGFAVQAWSYQQIRRMAEGLEPDLKRGVFPAFLSEQAADARLLKGIKASIG